jgi:hypothetical protein
MESYLEVKKVAADISVPILTAKQARDVYRKVRIQNVLGEVLERLMKAASDGRNYLTIDVLTDEQRFLLVELEYKLNPKTFLDDNNNEQIISWEISF